MASEKFNAHWAAEYTELRRAFTKRFPIDYKNLGTFKERVFRVVDGLTAEVEGLKEALGDLLDIQNGPPLVRDTEKWEEITARGYKLLALETETKHDPHQNS